MDAHASPAGDLHEAAVRRTVTAIDARMVSIPAGSIVIVDTATRRHRTERLKPYTMSKHVIIRGEYALLMGSDAGPEAEGVKPTAEGDKPVVNVSWYDAIEFCNKLSEKAGLQPCYGRDADDAVTWDRDADGYRLPSEAEWEFACRGGRNDAVYGELDDIAWYRDNSGSRPHAVGLKQPNRWGLHDMLGNVWEWCWDVFDEEVYGPYRVFRGGGWSDPAYSCRASVRRKSHPTFRIDDLGFRVARSLQPSEAI